MRVGIGSLIGAGRQLRGILVAPVRAMLAILAIALVLPSTTGGVSINRRIALVVGNGAYEHVSKLANPTNDAEVISKKLQELGFEVLTAKNVDLAAMRDTLGRFGREMAGAEVGLIFYAGHGMQVAGENFLLPVDARIRAADDLVEEGLQISAIHAEFAAAKPKVALLILDACRDNPFLKAKDGSDGLASGSVGNTGLARVRNTAGMLIAFAAAPGAVAADGRDGNSPFTTALNRWIDKPDLEIGLMFRRVRQTVLELTGGAQTPWVEESLLDEVYLRRSDPAEVDEQVQMVSLDAALWRTIHQIETPLERRAALEFYDRLLPESEFSAQARVEKAAYTPAATAGEDELVRQGLVWLSIRNSGDPALLEEYLRLNPDSMFVELARQRLADLRAAEEAPAPEPPQVLAAVEQTPPLVSATSEGAAPSAPLEILAPTATIEQPPAPEAPSAPPAVDVPAIDLGGTATAADTDVPVSTPIDLAPPAADAPAAEPPTIVIGSAAAEAPATPPSTETPAVVTTEPTVLPLSPSETEDALGLGEDDRAGVQRMLAAAGDYRGRIDADFGPGTRKAIAAFQGKAGIEETGYVSQPVLRHLVVETATVVLRDRPAANERAAIHKVAAIARNGPGSTPTAIRMKTIDRGDAVHTFWRDLADRFEADHPGVVVQLEHIKNEPYKAGLLVMLGSENPPDIFYSWGGGQLRALAEAGFARDLTSEMADGWAMTFKPGALNNFTIDQRIYGAPTLMSLTSFWYSKELFRQAGVDAESIRTWDDLLGAVQRLKAAGITPIAAGGRPRWPLQFYWGNLAQQVGGEPAFRDALAGAGDGFGNPAFVRAGELMQELMRLDPFPARYAEMTDSEAEIGFARGEAAMVLAGDWATKRIGANWPSGWERFREEIGRFDFPAVDAAGAADRTYGGTDGWVVNAGAPQEAVAFVRLLVDAGVQREMAAQGFSVPSAAGADEALKDPLLRGVAEELARSQYHQLFYDQALGPEAGEVVNDVALELAEGTIDPAGAAAAVEDAWEAVRF